jgi:NAD(P)-dependent dehydrogenase (short-subunit alcohol dehydrogenase family)
MAKSLRWTGLPLGELSIVSRVFITGSSEGLGLMAGQLLIEGGHEVILHARNFARADDARRALPQAEAVVVADVSTIAGATEVAEQANRLGRFDAIIHNVGIGYREHRRIETQDGLPHVFAVNVMAPYVLTALIAKPARLIYLSSGLHRNARADIADLTWRERRWNGTEAYAESKLYDVMLALAVARRWPQVFSNALEPGWVPTRMGGPGAPDDLAQAHRTQVWLATSNDSEALVTGQYFYHMRPRLPDRSALDPALQDRLLEACGRLTRVLWPD